MAFTSDDIQVSIEKLVLSAIRRPYDTLGTRRADISFNDIQEAAAGVFLLIHAAPFYTAFLGAQILQELIASESLLIASLLEAIDATGRQVFPIKDLTTLNNASSALFELEAAVGKRNQSFKSIETAPAYQRFKSNLDRFLAATGPNVKANGAIVQTPQEARAAIPAIVAAIEDAHLELVRRVGLLANAIDNYNKLNLPALAAAGVIARARQLVQQHTQTLESMGEKERLAVIRGVILDLLSSKAVVQKYGSFAAPATLLTIVGLGVPYSDAIDLANGGFVTGDLQGPFTIVSGSNVLDLRLDALFSAKVIGNVTSVAQVSGYKAQFNRATGSFVADGVLVGDVLYALSGPNNGTKWVITSVQVNNVQAMGSSFPQATGTTSIQIWAAPTESIPLALSYNPVITGSIREDFVVIAGENDSLDLVVQGTPVSVTLTAGTRTAQEICDDINAELVIAGLQLIAIAEPYLSPLKYDGLVDISVLGITGTFTLQVGSLTGLNILVGDVLKILSGPNAGLELSIGAVDVSNPSVFVQATDSAIVAATGVRIQLGQSGKKVQVRFLQTALAVSHKWSLACSANTVGANLLLGFPGGAVFTARPTRSAELVADVNSKSTKTVASRAFTAVTDTVLGRSVTTNISLVALYRFRGFGDVVAAPSSITVATSGLLSAGVVVGDTLVLRTGTNPNSVWTITSVTDTAIAASGVLTTTSAAGLEIEIGPTLSSVEGLLLQITSGPNSGEYPVITSSDVPFELLLDGVLPIYKDGFSQPLFFSVSLVEERIRLTSKNATTASRMTVNGTGISVISSTQSLSGGGTTVWFKLPAVPADLQPGDFLDLYASDYKTPSDSFGIVTIDRANGILRLDHALDSTVSWVFGDQPPPFAKLRSGRVYDYSVLQTQLLMWLARAQNKESYFIEMGRFLNPILLNENPTKVQIGDAKNSVNALYAFLNTAGATLANVDSATSLEDILNGYSVSPISDVDTLLQSFKEKGADRAIDVLLEGRFTDFFGLSMDEASYVGNMQLKMREVARNDLPVRKTDRDDATVSRQTVAIDDVDYEYSTEDIDDVQIDPPVN